MSTILDANGECTISFKIDAHTATILGVLGNHRGQTVNAVAKRIVEHWITKTHRDIQRENSKGSRNAAFQSNAGIVTRADMQK